MKRPSIFSGIAFACLAALLAYPLWWTAKYLIPFPDCLRVMSALVYLACVGHLLWTRRSRVGSVTLALVNMTLAAALPALPLPTSALIAIFAILVSLNRSLLWHRSVLAVILDATLTAAALSLAGYLRIHPWSFVAPLWGFLLVQSAWPLITSSPSQADEFGRGQTIDPFIHGHRQADAALRRIMEGEGV